MSVGKNMSVNLDLNEIVKKTKNLKKLKIAVASLSLLLLTACNQNNPSNDKEYYYYLHPEKLKAMYGDCHAQGPEHFESDPECGKVYTIAQNFYGLTQQFVNNQQAFGQQILRLQESVYQSQQALAQAVQSGDRDQAAKLTRQIQTQQLAVNKLRAIVGVFVQPG